MCAVAPLSSDPDAEGRGEGDLRGVRLKLVDGSRALNSVMEGRTTALLSLELKCDESGSLVQLKSNVFISRQHFSSCHFLNRAFLLINAQF